MCPLTVQALYAEVALATQEFSDTIAALGSSDLSKQLSLSLNALAEVERKSKELQDAQTKSDVVSVLGTGWQLPFLHLDSTLTARFCFSGRVHTTCLQCPCAWKHFTYSAKLLYPEIPIQ